MFHRSYLTTLARYTQIQIKLPLPTIQSRLFHFSRPTHINEVSAQDSILENARFLQKIKEEEWIEKMKKKYPSLNYDKSKDQIRAAVKAEQRRLAEEAYQMKKLELKAKKRAQKEREEALKVKVLNEKQKTILAIRNRATAILQHRYPVRNSKDLGLSERQKLYNEIHGIGKPSIQVHPRADIKPLTPDEIDQKIKELVQEHRKNIPNIIQDAPTPTQRFRISDLDSNEYRSIVNSSPIDPKLSKEMRAAEIKEGIRITYENVLKNEMTATKNIYIQPSKKEAKPTRSVDEILDALNAPKAQPPMSMKQLMSKYNDIKGTDMVVKRKKLSKEKRYTFKF